MLFAAVNRGRERVLRGINLYLNRYCPSRNASRTLTGPVDRAQ